MANWMKAISLDPMANQQPRRPQWPLAASTAAGDGTSPVCRWSIVPRVPRWALLEVMVNFDLAPDELAADYQLLEVDCSAVGVLSLNDDQPGEQWEDSRPLTQSIGSEWLVSGASALLKVPSAVVPKSWELSAEPPARRRRSRNHQIIESPPVRPKAGPATVFLTKAHDH